VNQVDAGHHLEQLAGEMGGASDTTRRHVELARIGLDVGDELGNGLGRNRWIHHHDAGLANNARHWRDVADEVEIEVVEERGVDGVRRPDQKQCVSVGRGTHDHLGGSIAARARPVLNDELLAKPLRQPLSDQARGDIESASWWTPD